MQEGILICRSCGFDVSICAELYPTFVRNIGAQKTLSQRKKELEQRRESFPEEFVVNPDGVLLNYTGSAETVVVPKGIQSIGKAFHFNKTIRKVILPVGLKRIGADAFSWSSLQSIELPESLTFIGRNAFANADLSSIHFPEKLKTMESSAFAETAIEEITIPGTMKLIPADAFRGCKRLRTVRLKSGVKTISSSAFQRCPTLNTIYIPDSLNWIETNRASRAFGGTDRIQTVHASDGWKKAHPELLHELIPDPVEENNYRVEGTRLISYCGRAPEPQIPEKVTIIGRGAFSENSHIQRIVIPDHVASIEASAFFFCENLREVTLPDPVTEIDAHTFCGCCNLRDVHFPRNLRAIRKYAFSGTAFQVLALPPGLSRLGSACFTGCERLSEVHLPEALETIDSGWYKEDEYDVFDPRWIKRFYVSQAWARSHQDFLKAYPNAEIRYEEAEIRQEKTEIRQEKEKTPSWPEDFEVSGTELVRYKGRDQEVAVPKGITEIGAKAFEASDCIRRVVLPDTVRSIRAEAFRQSSLEEITLPQGLERISEGAFRDSRLKKVYFPNSLLSIGSMSFSGTMLQSVDLPGTLPMIPKSAFEGCVALITVRIRNGVKALGPRAFSFCPALETIELPDSLTEICQKPKDGAFVGSGSITTVLASSAWKDANPDLLREMIPDPDEAKNYAARDHVLIRYYGRAAAPVIPDHVTVIGEYSFLGNAYIRKIKIPKGVKYVADGAFSRCSNLSEVSLPSTLRALGAWSFAGTGISRLEVPPQLSAVKPHTFEACDKLTEISFPDSLRTVDEGAFDRLMMQNIRRINASEEWEAQHKVFLSRFPNAVVVHPSDGRNQPVQKDQPVQKKKDPLFLMKGSKLVRYTGRNARVTVPEGTTEIGARAFEDHRELRLIELPETVAAIREYAFANCGNLSGLRLPNGIQTIEKGAFYGCDQIAAVAKPYVLLNFRKVQIQEGNECLMRGALISVASVDSVLDEISLNLADITDTLPYSFQKRVGHLFTENFAKAAKAYAGKLLPGERPILLYDDSAFCNGMSGLLLTSQRICYKRALKKGSCPFTEILGFVSREEQFALAVRNGEKTSLPFVSKATGEKGAMRIIAGALDAACQWLRLLNEAPK